MSRHLMAKMGSSRGAAEWNQGPLPHSARDVEHWNAEHAAPFNYLDPDWYSHALVNHGETRWGLQVRPMEDEDYGKWEWSLHRQVGPDLTNPDHWEDMSTGDNTPLCACYPHSHARDGHAGEVVDPEFQNGDYSYSDRGELMARRAAEEGLAAVLAQGRGIGDYDINQIMRDEGFQ